MRQEPLSGIYTRDRIRAADVSTLRSGGLLDPCAYCRKGVLWGVGVASVVTHSPYEY